MRRSPAPARRGRKGNPGNQANPAKRESPANEAPKGSRDPPGGPGGAGNADDGLSVRLYGDGSLGELVVETGEDVTLPADSATYSSIRIESGGTLRVRSGTVIRVTGDVENDGLIFVRWGTYTGVRYYGSAASDPVLAPPGEGISLAAPGFGTVDLSNPARAIGGAGGVGIGSAARWLLAPTPFGGGGGANSWPFTAYRTDSGGGSFHLRAGGTISNAGKIEADGSQQTLNGCGTGGGGGGVIIIASATAFDGGGGEVFARGGTGQAGDSQCGAGGGGGGGLIHIIAPQITEGTLDVSGGAPGIAGTWTSTIRSIGGGGGGASVGDGGRGGGHDGTAPQNAYGGERGRVYITEADPEDVL